LEEPRGGCLSDSASAARDHHDLVLELGHVASYVVSSETIFGDDDSMRLVSEQTSFW
jgi:hypothetical protein